MSKKRETHSEANDALPEMGDSDEGWMSTPERYAVDGIVAALKNRAFPKILWSRTASSLRRLNKHWCREMNRHIDHINPKHLHEDEVAQRLHKFPNLTSLDVSNLASYKKCSTLLRALRTLPKLSRFAMSAQSLFTIKKDDLEGLVCRTVELKPGTSHVLRTLDFLMKLSVIKMEEFEINCSIDGKLLAPFLAAAPSIKRMKIHEVDSEECFEALAALDELDIGYSGHDHSQLGMLTKLMSLNVLNLIDSFEAFVPLKNLKKLQVTIIESFVFDQAFTDVVRQLEDLSIMSFPLDEPDISLPVDFWQTTGGLKSLAMIDWVIDVNSLGKIHFQKMQQLSLIDCVLHGETMPWNRLATLKALVLKSVCGVDKSSILGSMDLSPLQDLISLELQFSSEQDVSLQLLQSIKQLSSLVHLKLTSLDDLKLRDLKSAIESLEELPQLMDSNVEEFVQSHCL